jgi:TatD DNase family protein
MLIDTHTHIADLSGVDKIIRASAETSEIVEALAAAKSDPRIFCTLGIHPERASETPEYENLLGNPKVVGVGEIGLDYHGNNAPPRQQVALFERQLEIARHAKLPIAIHSRDAEDDTMSILQAMPSGGVMHCFTSSRWDFARTMLDRGFYISASGILTFKNAAELRDIFARIPNDRIVSETDSPYCAPIPFRGQECRPAMMIETIKVLAAIKNIPQVEMEDILWNNAHRLYPKL